MFHINSDYYVLNPNDTKLNWYKSKHLEYTA